MRKNLAAIYDNAIKSYRKGTVNPDEVVAKTTRRLGVTANKDPETFTLILIVIGAMSAFLLARFTREKNRSR